MVHVVLLSLAWRSADNLIHPQNHLRCLGGIEQDAFLELKRFDDSKLLRVADCSIDHVKASSRVALVMFSPQLRCQISTIITAILSNDSRKASQSSSEPLDSVSLLSGSARDEFIDCLCHQHLRATSTEHDSSILDGFVHDAQSIVERSFGLIEDVVGCSPDDDRACLAHADTRKANHTILSEHNLFDELASAKPDEFRMLERAHNFTTGDLCKSFDSIEISVFDRNDAVIGEVLLSQVVDKLTSQHTKHTKQTKQTNLTIDEASDSMVDDLLALLDHSLALRCLDVGNLLRTFGLDRRRVDFDFIGIHCRVCDQDLRILQQ
jgi:hypothetical protein